MLSPLTWLILLLLLGYLVKKKPLKRLCYLTAVMVFLVFSSPAVYQAYARWYQPEPVVLSPDDRFSAGIVAGGFGSVDYNGEGYFNSASDRFLQAVRLYHTGVIGHIIISGGNSKDNDKGFREGAWAKQQMMEMGVPASGITVEDRSNNTRDNARNSKMILDSMGIASPCLLITSAFHLPRAMKMYEQAGVQVKPYPCNYTEGRGPIKARDFIPSIGTMTAWPKYVREAAARGFEL